MAGDWIPIRTGLEDEPEVVRIVGALSAPACRDLRARMRTTTMVLGALQRTWSLFDRYSEDGVLHGYTAEWLDSSVGIDGWSENLQRVGWLEVKPEFLRMRGFETWLGQSSKRRLSENKRKSVYKKQAAESGRIEGAKSALQKRREEKSIERERERRVRDLGENHDCIEKWFEYVFQRDGSVPEVVRDTVTMNMIRFATANSDEKLSHRVDASIAGGCRSNEPWYSERSSGGRSGGRSEIVVPDDF